MFLITVIPYAYFTNACAFVHPGILHTQADLDRMKTKVDAEEQPWKSGWDRLVANSFSQASHTPNPQDTVCCGGNGCPNGETFMPLARDCAAAYQNALRYRIPSAAKPSRLGVFTLGFPTQPRAAARHWSVSITNTLGCLGNSGRSSGRSANV